MDDNGILKPSKLQNFQNISHAYARIYTINLQVSSENAFIYGLHKEKAVI
jgi:hypothetical protein